MKTSRFVSSKEIARTITTAGRQKLYYGIHLGRIEGAKSSPNSCGVLITRDAFQAWISDPAHAKYLRAAQMTLSPEATEIELQP